ncbi:hypothetical protein B0H11DRAFT_2214789 [Mycena galericulata]|nr:hypothetical protein B0H11DRAFT_2214789 [Mycena galericulata]
MSANDCCGMLLSCCMCFSLCSHSSDSSTIRFCINLFPERWCRRFDDTSAADEVMAERDHEAALFDQRNNNVSAQPTSVPAMAVDAKSARTPAVPNIRDKAHILPTFPTHRYDWALLFPRQGFRFLFSSFTLALSLSLLHLMRESFEDRWLLL